MVIVIEAVVGFVLVIWFLLMVQQGKTSDWKIRRWKITKPDHRIEGSYEKGERERKEAANRSERYRAGSFAQDIIKHYGRSAPNSPRKIIGYVDSVVREADLGTEGLPPGYSMKRTELLTLENVADHYNRPRLKRAAETLLEEGRLTATGRILGLGKIAKIGEPPRYGLKEHAIDVVKDTGRKIRKAGEEAVLKVKRRVLPSEYK